MSKLDEKSNSNQQVPEDEIPSSGVSRIEVSDPSIFSKLFVTWLSPLISLGYRRPLESIDLPNLFPAFYAKPLREKLESSWEHRKREGGDYRLLWACKDTFGKVFFAAGFLKFIGDCCALISPLLLRIIISTLRGGKYEIRDGVLLSTVVFLLQIMNTWCVNYYFTLTMQIGLQIRSSNAGLIYGKALRLSGKARQRFSTGQIVNLMSTDCNRIDIATSYLHYVWSGPFQVIVIMGLMFQFLGRFAMVGLAILLVAIPIQSKISAWLLKYRKELSNVTDKRVRLLQEMIQGIRVIKFYGWEKSFMKKLFDLREIELHHISKTKRVRSLFNVMSSFISIFACVMTFLTYYWCGSKLTSDLVFPVITLFNLLRLPLMLLPMVLGMAVDGSVSIKRIQKFLMSDDLDFAPTTDFKHKDGIVVQGGSFVWESAEDSTNSSVLDIKEISRPSTPAGSASNLISECPSPIPATPEPIQNKALSNINFTVPRGNLTAVIGSVGSGKSSLLSAIIGEMKCIGGQVILGGHVAYCPQQAWIQNATVRENILFGKLYNSELYDEVVSACDLKPDFAVLPDGDQTEIGEKGVNLSGGQKQRISLARAAYSDVEIILLDDPLSAVDAHVGKHILEQCINKCMSGRTRLLVSNQPYILPFVDYVLVMADGQIVEEGLPYDLQEKQAGLFNVLMNHDGMKSYNGSNNDSGKSSRIAKKSIFSPKGKSSTVNKVDIAPALFKHTAAEERHVGAVDFSVYKDYMAAAGGSIFVISVLGATIVWNSVRLFSDFWIANWTSAKPTFVVSDSLASHVYLVFGLSQGCFALFGSLACAWGGVKAAKSLFSLASKGVFYANVHFFDTTPTGRIINRFSREQDVLDNMIIESLKALIDTFSLTAFSFLSMVIFNYVFSIPLMVLLIFYFFVQRFYRTSSRELKRLESLSRSPLYSQFGETLTGLPTIRAFTQQERFVERNEQLIDENNRAAFVQLAIQRWLGIRLESIGTLIIFSACLCCFIFPIDPSFAGMVIGYSLSVTGVMNWCIRQFADVETNIISSERLDHYAHQLPQEPAHELPSDLDLQWPTAGAICITNLVMKYRPELDPVLKGVSVDIKAGERIGIVGRTGAGKSSIMQSLFRMVEPSEGQILIDGVDISTIGLTKLRQNISIIPQDPVVFEGSVRWNLDPTEQHSDEDLWNALDRAHLKNSIKWLEGGLDGAIHEGGNNLSVGERQLLCLARAILKKNCILVMDEATANIDLATDVYIQNSIRQDFANCTILTIAHRISTVVDYDKILVLDKGCIVEFDSPSKLLEKVNGHFASLFREANNN